MIKKVINYGIAGNDLGTMTSNVGMLIARVIIGLSMAFAHGLGKLPPTEIFIGKVEAMGFPLAFLFAWFAGLGEFLGGIMIACGVFTRFGSGVLISIMIVAAFIRHLHDPFAQKELAIIYLAASLVIFVSGAGKYSVDHYLNKSP